MEALAQLIWDPFLCLIYLVLGCVFALLTRGLAWRRVGAVIRSAWSAPRRGRNSLSHRDGFIAALGATVGVGNLAGVATALHLGGPGALFWMWVSAILGMNFRLASTYLAIKYQPKSDRAPSFATPMLYLERFLPPQWRFMAKVLAVLLVGIGFINANLIQSNSVAHAVTRLFHVPALPVAVAIALLVGLVIIAGLRSIVRFSIRATPLMVLAYTAIGLIVLMMDPADTFRSLRSVFTAAFHPRSVLGGAAGTAVFSALQFGVSRGVFSHGSGIAMAPFFQAKNRDHPGRGALMAAAVPAFDTLIVCTITGLVILSRGHWRTTTSAYLTVSSFENALGVGGRLLVLSCLVIFALTTIVSWAHFSERCFQYLGGKDTLAFRLVFAAVTFIGPFFPVALVWSLGDVLVGVILVVHLFPLLAATTIALDPMRSDIERMR